MRVLVVLLILVSGECRAGPYVEFGGFYTQETFWINDTEGNRLEESGVIGHVAAGYEIERGKWLIDFQLYRHQSDPKYSGDRDLTAQDSSGVAVRYRF